VGTKQVWTPVESETSLVVAKLKSFSTLLCKSVRTRHIASAGVSCTDTAGLTVALLSKPVCVLNL
jgi:hypothetical protein